MKMILKFWFRRTVVGLLAGLALRALGQAPTVISVTPANNATGVATNVTMVLRFSAAMDADSFIPSFHLTFQPMGPFSSPEWNDGNTEVSLPIAFGGFAGGTKYTWTLTPGGSFPGLPQFTSAAGVPVVATSGSFTTGGSGGGGTTVGDTCTIADQFDPAVIAVKFDCEDPNDPGTNQQSGFVFVSRRSEFNQISANEIRASTNEPFEGGVFVSSPSGSPFTAVAFTAPGQAQRVLEAQFGFFTYNQTFPSQAALEQGFPAGNYAFAITKPGGNANLNLNLSSGLPTAVRVTNFDDAQRVTPAQPFTLRWQAITGAGANDSLELVVTETCTHRIVYIAPNLCVPIQLRATDTSIVIPAGTLLVGKRYEGRLSYTKGNFSNFVPGTIFTGSSSSTETTFPINNPGTPPASAVKITSFTQSAGGFQLEGTGAASKPYAIEVSTSLSGWSELATKTTDATGKLSHTIPAGGGNIRFFRLKAK